jgi:hypothetical protein
VLHTSGPVENESENTYRVTRGDVEWSSDVGNRGALASATPHTSRLRTSMFGPQQCVKGSRGTSCSPPPVSAAFAFYKRSVLAAGNGKLQHAQQADPAIAREKMRRKEPTNIMGEDPWINLEKMQWPEEDHGARAREPSKGILRQFADINGARMGGYRRRKRSRNEQQA